MESMARATGHMHSSRWQVRLMRCGSKSEAEPAVAGVYQQAHDIVPAAGVAWAKCHVHTRDLLPGCSYPQAISFS